VKEFVVYTLARIGLFVASYAVIGGIYAFFAGSMIGLVPFLLAVVVSAVASYYLLSGLRKRFALKVEERASRMSSKLEEVRAREDQD
jgi:CHASE2 domain-containing sensor protein